MAVLLQFLIFAVGLVFLVKGADMLVSGSSSLAKRFNISDIVIGLTIVAFGTSMPELIVSTMAAVSGTTDISIGNVVGSNIANILLILGIASVIYPLSVKSATVWKEIPFAFLAAILLVFLSFDTFFGDVSTSVITRGDALVLLATFSVFLYYIVLSAKSDNNTGAEEIGDQLSVSKTAIFILLGLVGLTLGGYWMVESAKSLAGLMGMSERVIGLTVVAIGTSLPELATSVAAARRKNADIAIGNIVGSNIFNIMWILGLTALIQPLPVLVNAYGDILFMLVVTSTLFAALLLGKKHTLERWQGASFLVVYVAYTVFLLLR